MLDEPKFNSRSDIQAAVPGLAINLGETLRSGRIPVKVGPSEVCYNGIQNPSSIGSRPADIFDSMRMEKETYQKAKKAAAAQKAAASTEPASGGAPATSQE